VNTPGGYGCRPLPISAYYNSFNFNEDEVPPLLRQQQQQQDGEIGKMVVDLTSPKKTFPPETATGKGGRRPPPTSSSPSPSSSLPWWGGGSGNGNTFRAFSDHGAVGGGEMAKFQFPGNNNNNKGPRPRPPPPPPSKNATNVNVYNNVWGQSVFSTSVSKYVYVYSNIHRHRCQM
jgi:hypothetical protein